MKGNIMYQLFVYLGGTFRNLTIIEFLLSFVLNSVFSLQDSQFRLSPDPAQTRGTTPVLRLPVFTDHSPVKWVNQDIAKRLNLFVQSFSSGQTDEIIRVRHAIPTLLEIHHNAYVEDIVFEFVQNAPTDPLLVQFELRLLYRIYDDNSLDGRDVIFPLCSFRWNKTDN